MSLDSHDIGEENSEIGNALETNLSASAMSILSAAGLNDVNVAKSFKRDADHRVFVNRSLNLAKIKFCGFDLDYTLAVYKSPKFESLAFNMAIEHLIAKGYPNQIKDFVYDPTFAVRGLFFDKKFGTLLKVDTYGNLLMSNRGFHFLTVPEVRNLYPNKMIQLKDDRFYSLSTLFHLPEIYLLACVVDYFTNSEEYRPFKLPTGEQIGVMDHELYISFGSVFQDCRSAMDWIHSKSDFKRIVVENCDEYLHRDSQLPILLNRIREHGTKLFLLTNSEFDYADRIMKYLINSPDMPWEKYFDIVIVDAKKPTFFEDGSVLRRYYKETGTASIGIHSGPLIQGEIYVGGSSQVFSQSIGAKGTDILYIGDHVYTDVLKSKLRGWKTMLIVPELALEVFVWKNKRSLFTGLQNLDAVLNDLYRDQDMSSTLNPDTSNILDAIGDVSLEIDLSYGKLGSLFKSGTRQTFFSSQLARYADLYAACVVNLLYYPSYYLFRAPPILLPHEATIDPDATGSFPKELISSVAMRGNMDDVKKSNDKKRTSTERVVPHLMCKVPRTILHHHDLDDSEEYQTEDYISDDE